MSFKLNPHIYPQNYLLIILLLLANGQSVAKTDTSNHVNKLALYITPTAWLDPWDGCSTRTGMEYSLTPDLSICIDGAIYFHSQPAICLKNDINGYMIRPMMKYYVHRQRQYTAHNKFKGTYIGKYFAAELIFKHQVFNRDDSIVINYAPPFDKVYTINRYASGVNFMYGEAITYKWGLIVDYYLGAGFRFKHSTSSLSPTLENGILAGENHGDVIGDAERATGNNYLPVLFFGIKIGYRLL